MPQKEKIGAREKVQIVEKYLRGEMGQRAACHAAGIVWSTLQQWVSLYRAEGAEGFLPQKGKRTYSLKAKRDAVLEYLSGDGSQREICEKHQIRSSRQLRAWLEVYNRHEDFNELSGGSHMTEKRKSTVEERLEIVRACIAMGNDYGGAAHKYQVSYQQVYAWTKKYRKMGEAGLEDRRGRRTGTLPSRTPEEELRDKIAQLERKNFDLEMENALLKKVKELGRR